MPFLDHLEELRWRIIWSFLALVAGTLIGFVIVQHYDVLALLKRPIAELLPEGKLFVTRPAEAFIITLKLAAVVGLVLAGPVIAWQTWIFLAPALYEHEKRFVLPTIAAGLVLFLIGAAMAYFWVLPAALKILFSFQREDLEFIITANEYFSFASLFILAFGLVFELPLIMVVLAAFGLVDPALFARNRPIALVVGAIVAALLTPPDAFSMMMMLVPVMVLYEVGIAVAKMFWRGRRAPRTAASTAAVIGLLIAASGAAPAPAESQVAQQRRTTDSTAPDSVARGQPVDTATARKLGLPTAPSRSFPSADSLMQALMKREGFRVTRYAADSLTLYAPDKEIALTGRVLVEREGSTLEADTVRFFQADCRLAAAGEPTLFDRSTVLRGEGMGYNTCEHRGIVAEALTSFNQSGVEWFLRGALAVDSASTRIYARRSTITSSDLPMPDYHFGAGQIKWVSNTIMVARPAVLYVRDVPVLWLPFIFQDMRQGRRSGILVPRFGINDLLRPNRGYRRHVDNIGFYLALNDYMDAQASLDWYSGQSVQLNGRLQYRWLDRFITGNVGLSQLYQIGETGAGSRSLHLNLSHDQSFDMRTRLNAAIDYATSATVLQRNSVDPLLATASLASSANFNKQYDWGTIVLGGRRQQDLSSGVVTQSLPTLSLTPRPINIGRSVTWTPGFTVDNQQTLHQSAGTIDLPPVSGLPIKDSLFIDSRTTRVQIQSPIRIGWWNWSNSFSINDAHSNRRSALRLPDPANPGDSVTRFYAEEFSTGVDWNTSIGLPALFPSTWRIQPSVGIANAASGEFLLRNRFTEGRFVHQSKRLSFGAAMSPAVFGFFPGFGPLLRIRHAVSPSLSWQYAPPGSVSEEYARAIDPTGLRRSGSKSVAQHRLTFSLSQTFEAKLRAPAGDTAGERNARKLKLLSVQTSGVTYDFEQAKEAGRTGWTTSSVSNSFTSDLLPGFSISTNHDLWRGAVGTDTAQFEPFLSSVSLRFGVSAQTFARVLAWLTGGPAPDVGPEPPPQQQQPPFGQTTGPLGGRPGARPTEEVAAAASVPRGRGLEMSVSYDDQRFRSTPTPGPGAGALAPNRTLGLRVGFSPTINWVLSWDTQYNFTTKEFGQHLLRLERDLNRWRATFSFIKSPNGNFAFNFFISLLDQPEIKFQYDQRTVR